MPTFLIVILCLMGALFAVGGFGFAVLAAADAEGRGGDYALTGLGFAAVGLLAFAGFGICALVRGLA